MQDELNLSLEAIQCITRFEVIDHTKSFDEGGGMILSRNDIHVQLLVQDEGRTLKVFLNQE